MVREHVAGLMTGRSWVVSCFVTAFVALVTCLPVSAIEPPSADEVERMKQAGVFEERMARAEGLGLYRPSIALQQKALRKIQIEALKLATGRPAFPAWGRLGGPAMAFPYTKPPELKPKGKVKTLTILVDFKDLRAADDRRPAGMEVATFQENIYGKGTVAAEAYVPYESMREYYRRASHYEEDGSGNVTFGVDVDGKVLGWCHLGKDRDEYEPTVPGDPAWNRAIFDLAVEALTKLDGSEDFSEYDNDDDGDIDLITILYAGPPAGWMSFWWAYRWEFHDSYVPEADTRRFDGKRLRQFVFQFVSKRSGNDFDPTTLIHEMGHAFGLPDYYDYKPGYPNKDVDGGTGGLDMMDAARGNHNAFSRWCLDWIAPEVIGSAVPTAKTLRAAGSTNRSGAVAVFPGLRNGNAPGQELFIIENRQRIGNDAGTANMPGEGLLVWHVDATPKPDNSGFLMDNSRTSHKLLRLVRADNPKDFVDGESATGGCYYNSGERFTPTSSPNSNRNNGTVTGVSMTNISPNGEVATATIGILPGPVGGPPEMLSAAARKKSPQPKALAGKVAANRGQPIDLEEVERFLAEFQRASPKELKQAWVGAYEEKLLRGPADQNTLLLQVLLTQLAAKDGKEAAEILQTLPSGAFKSQVFPSVMEAWAYNSPKGAANWYLAPAQAELRASKPAAADGRFPGAMRQFAETIYKWSAMRNPTQAVSAIDKLERLPEIDGALRGVCQANELIGRDDQQLNQGIKNLKRNRDTAEALLRIQNAEQKIQDPKKRMEFRQFMQQRGPR